MPPHAIELITRNRPTRRELQKTFVTSYLADSRSKQMRKQLKA